MRLLFGTACLLLGLCSSAQPGSRDAPPRGKRSVIAADTAIDGKGGAFRKTRIIIEGSKIVAVDPKAKPIDYDLRGLTVLPGWIDAHVHITSIFGKDGKSPSGDGTTQEDAFRHASNAWVTLMAGFTTVQSMGSPGSVALRDAIANGSLPGPRILTAVERWADAAGRNRKFALSYASKRKPAPTLSRFTLPGAYVRDE